MQRKDLIAYCELILGIEDYEIFEDAGYSGKNTDRPAFQEMMQKIRAGSFSHLLVWKIDRISRNLLDFAEMYEELQSLRVTFVSKNEQFDTSNAMGEAMLKIILVFAELERNMTSERVTATMISSVTPQYVLHFGLQVHHSGVGILSYRHNPLLKRVSVMHLRSPSPPPVARPCSGRTRRRIRCPP